MPKSTQYTDKQRAQIYARFVTAIENNDIFTENSPTANFYKPLSNVLTPPTRPPATAPSYKQPNQNPFFVPQAQPTNAQAPFAEAYVYNTPRVIHHHHHENAGIPWWAWWSMTQRNNPQVIYVNNSPQQREKKQEANFAAWMFALILVAVVTAPAVLGSAYLLSELWNNFERLYYNEGYWQAGLGLANIVASLSVSTLLINAVLASAITALCVSAGFANPLAWSFFILGCVTLFTAACLHWVLQEGIYGLTAALNQNELHPEEPYRFAITDDNVATLKRQDNRANRRLDADNMQNVITAIHHDMEENSTFMSRTFRYSPFFRDNQTSEKLAAIRNLRMNGTVDYTSELVGQRDEIETLHFTNQHLRA